MNTLHLRYAVEVEKCASITQAAENLFMAQPNLSKAIRELEESIGYPIFERTAKGMLPTPAGRRFLALANSVLSQVEEMESLSQQKAMDAQAFSLSYPRASYVAEGVTRFLDAMDKRGPIDVRLQETNSMQTALGVSQGRFRLGILRYTLSNEPYFLDYLKEKNLACEPLWTFDMRVAMSEFHPLAQRRALAPQDLGPYIELAHGDASVPYLPASAAENRPERAGDKRALVFERSIQLEILSRVTVSYMWVSPIPEKVLVRNGLIERVCSGEREAYKDALIYPAAQPPTAFEQGFLAHLNAARMEAFQKTVR